MARVKVLTDRGWIEIPPPFTDINVTEDVRIQATTIRGFVSFSSTNEYLTEYGECMDERSRPKGEWLTEVYEYGKDGEEDKWVVRPAEEGDCAYCSLCGKTALLDGGENYVLSPYCPHCGEPMSVKTGGGE